jgi:hypothetical protein
MSLLSALLLGGCDNASGPREEEPPAARVVQLSGEVQKGRFTELSVAAYSLSATGARGDRVAATITADRQGYLVDLEATELVLLEAEGSFTSEIDGSTIELDQPLLAVVDVREDASAFESNINIATTLEASWLLARVESFEGGTDALLDAGGDLLNASLGFPAGTDAGTLSYSGIDSTSTVADPDLQLLLLSAALVGSLDDSGQLYAGGFDAVAQDFSAASSVEEAVVALGSLDGYSSEWLYGQALVFGGYDLPLLTFTDIEILGCLADTGTCSWETESDPALNYITVSSPTVREADGGLQAYIRFSRPTAAPVSLRLFTTDETAVAGLDFVGRNEVIEVPVGTTQIPVPMPLIIDALAESDETFIINAETGFAGYAVRRPGLVTIRDVLPIVAERRTDQLAVVELCVLGTGKAGALSLGACDSATVSGGFVNEPDAALAASLDLAAACGASATCPPRDDDWLVQFFLVADEGGRPRDERALGTYIYPVGALQDAGRPADARSFLLSLAAPAASGLAEQAFIAGWTLRLEARIVGAPALAAAAPAGDVLFVPAEIRAGDSTLAIAEVIALDPDGGAICEGGRGYRLEAGFVVGELPGLPGLERPIVVYGEVCIGLEEFAPDQSRAVLTAGNIDLTASGLSLPAGHGTLIGGGFPLPIYLPDVLEFRPGQPTYLYQEDWPFSLRISAAELNPGGIELQYTEVRSLLAVDYAPTDPRAPQNSGALSNAPWLQGGAGAGSLFLGPAGVSGTLAFNPGAGQTVFPRGEVAWQAYSYQLQGSRLQGTTPVVTAYSMTQSTACPTPDCRADAEIEYVVQAQAQLDGRGFLLGAGTTTDAVTPAWGAHPGSGFAFERPGDLPAGGALHLALPGYRAPAGGRPGDYLLAHVQSAAPGEWLRLHPARSRAFRDGNYHPVGISVGPEIYRDPVSGAPVEGAGRSLAGLPLQIDNQVDAVALDSSVGAKYVARTAGITGVFNVASGELAQPVPFYGYPLQFDRFAIRLTDNEVDEFNWLDGRLALEGDIGGPFGLTTYFSNLAINCAARLGNMRLDWEQCDGVDNDGDGVPDENCSVTLHSWRAPAEVYAASFSGAQSCAADSQSFTLEHDVRFAALDRPVGFRTGWNPEGRLAFQESKLAAQYRVDRRPNRPETGFGFSPAGEARLTVGASGSGIDGRYGALVFPDVRVSVPFWNALQADVRIANGSLGPEDSVVVAAGALRTAEVLAPGREAEAPNSGAPNSEVPALVGTGASLTASYDWGDTGYGFDLPVRFQPFRLDLSDDANAVGLQSRFVGVTETADLFVLEAERVVNFIEPRRTKMSFGASANLADLGNISFQLDLDNPDTLRRVDDFLISVGILSQPVLEPGLSDVQDAVFAVNRLAGRGLEELTREGLERSLESLGAAAADFSPFREDPFVTASERLAAVNALPAQLVDLVETPLRAPFEAAVNDLAGPLRSELLQLREDVEDLDPGEEAGDETLARVQAARALVGTALARLDAVDGAIAGTISEAAAVNQQIESYATQAWFAVLEIERVLERAVTFLDSSCSNGFIPGAELNGYLEEVIVRFTSVRQLLELVGASELLLPLSELLAEDPEVRDRIRNAQASLARQAEELAGFLATADAAVRGTVCTSQVDSVLARSGAVIDRIELGIGAALGTSVVVEARLAQLQLGLAEALGAARDPLTDTATLLDSLQRDLSAPLTEPGSVLLSQLESWLESASGGAVNRLVATAPGDRDVVELLTGPVRDAVDDLFAGLRGQVDQLQLLPGGYTTPDQLRRLLVAEIMQSAPVRQLHAEMNRHFDEIGQQVTGLVLQLTDQLNFAIRKAVASVESSVNGVLDEALAPVRNMPLQAFDMDGFAVIAGNELERVRLGAQWELGSVVGDGPTGFAAALEAVRWGAVNGPGTCGVAGAASRLDVTISAYGLPLPLPASDLEADVLMLGFTLAPTGDREIPLSPRGLMGGISTTGEIGFGSVTINDPGFEVGIGDVQNYLGARADARFGDIQGEAAFLLGRICSTDNILARLDPDVDRFIDLPAEGFTGGYVRGGATIPIILGGCFLNFSVRGDFGAWVLGRTWGGLVGGGAIGEVFCVGALRGQVTVLGEKTANGNFRFLGEGFGVAGGGWCEPETWTTVARSRRDEWCGTGDAQLTLEYNRGWNILRRDVDGTF